MGQDDYDHLRESADAADFDEVQPRCEICGRPQWREGEDWNGETGNHFSCEARQKAAQTEEPLACPVPDCIVEGLNDPDELLAHLADEHTDEERIAAGRKQVLDEIVDEVNNGNAHLMTRNQLVEFIKWAIKEDDRLNELEYAYLNSGDPELNPRIEQGVQELAKEWFVRCEYERAAETTTEVVDA